MKKAKISLVALSACMLVLSACGGSSEKTSSADVSSNDISSYVVSSTSSLAETSSINNPSSSTAPSSTKPVASSQSSASSSSSVASSSSSVIQSFNITINSSELVTAVVTGGNTQKEGSNVSLKVTLKNSKVRIDTFSIVDSSNKNVQYKEAGDTYTFTMPSSNVTITITAHEEQAKYTITAESTEDYTIVVNDNVTSAVAGTNIVFTVTAKNPAKDVGTVSVKDINGASIGVNKGTNNTYSVLMPSANITITATVVNKQFKIIEPTNENVYFNVIGLKDSFEAGEEVMLSIAAKYGYKINSVTAKGETSNNEVTLTKGETNYTLVMPAENVVFTFDVEEMYTISVTNDLHLEIALSEIKDYYAKGSEVSFVVNSSSDRFVIDTLEVKTGETTVNYEENEGTYTFVMPEGNVTIVVTEKSNQEITQDPFTEPTTFEGTYYYDDNYRYIYLMRFRVTFNGNGSMSYWITYEVDYDYGDEYGEWEAYEKGPSTGLNIKYVIPQGMGGEGENASRTNFEYEYDGEADQIVATFGYNASSTTLMHFDIIRTGEEITSLKTKEDLGSGFFKTKNCVLRKI